MLLLGASSVTHILVSEFSLMTLIHWSPSFSPRLSPIEPASVTKTSVSLRTLIIRVLQPTPLIHRAIVSHQNLGVPANLHCLSFSISPRLAHNLSLFIQPMATSLSSPSHLNLGVFPTLTRVAHPAHGSQPTSQSHSPKSWCLHRLSQIESNHAAHGLFTFKPPVSTILPSDLSAHSSPLQVEFVPFSPRLSYLEPSST